MPFATASDGVRIHYEVEGDGPPLALVHGNGRSLDDWHSRGYVERLRDRFTLILIDARGFGRSDKPSDEASYAFRNRVMDIVAVLDALRVETAHLFGYSMGGSTTMNAVTYAPARFRSFIIGGHSPNGAVDSTSGQQTWAEAWEELKTLPYADHDAWQACRAVSRTFTGGVDALTATSLPILLFAGEDDRGPFEGDRQFAAEHGTPFFSLPGKDHADAVAASDLVAPRIIEFIERIEASRGR